MRHADQHHSSSTEIGWTKTTKTTSPTEFLKQMAQLCSKNTGLKFPDVATGDPEYAKANALVKQLLKKVLADGLISKHHLSGYVVLYDPNHESPLVLYGFIAQKRDPRLFNMHLINRYADLKSLEKEINEAIASSDYDKLAPFLPFSF